MDNIKKFSKKGLKKFEFVNESGSTRHGFYHKTTLIENDYYILATHKCNYLNRTWECYTYQTVMLCAVNDVIEEKKAELLEDYKQTNNIKRLTKEKKADFEKTIAKNARIKELKKLYKELKESRF